MKTLEPTVHQKLKAANDLATDKTIMLYNSFFFLLSKVGNLLCMLSYWLAEPGNHHLAWLVAS